MVVMVSSKVSSRSREREGFRRPSDREDIDYRGRGQLGLATVGTADNNLPVRQDSAPRWPGSPDAPLISEGTAPIPPEPGRIQTPSQPGVWSGVKIGCGMFIVLPLIILALIVFFFLFIAASGGS